MIYGVLTYGIINTQLNNALANACLYGTDVISKLNQGIGCKSEKKTAQKILDLVDSISIYGQVIPNTPSVCIYSTSAWSGGTASFTVTVFLSFLIGGVNSFTSSSVATITLAWNSICSQINTAAGYQVCVYDAANTQFVFYDPSNSGASFNGNSISVSVSGSGKPTNIIPSTASFSGGTTGNANTTFLDTITCIKTNQVESILDKLTKLGILPCTTIENL
jgi:hypothetical protein